MQILNSHRLQTLKEKSVKEVNIHYHNFKHYSVTTLERAYLIFKGALMQGFKLMWQF